MPELPDVEVFKRYLDATSLHKTIEHVEVLLDAPVLGQAARRRIRQALTGDRFRGFQRHGKYLFAILEEDGALVLHFGMTGFLQYFKQEETDTAHNVLRIVFNSGYSLVYNNNRRLGLVDLTANPERLVQSKGLGPDALDIDPDQFGHVLDIHRGHIKSLLMNQQAIAGLGHVYSDEILFQAGLHPRRTVQGLSVGERRRLLRSMGRVLRQTIAKGADPERYPRTFLTPYRSDGAACPRCGAPLRRLTIGGRSAYYCPRRQREP
ncbi:MAG: DNA-formamidopyrimidine glycosylase family protein [Gammaproteobacteria bacterium]